MGEQFRASWMLSPWYCHRDSPAQSGVRSMIILVSMQRVIEKTGPTRSYVRILNLPGIHI